MGKNPYAAALSSMTRPGLPAGVTLTYPSRRRRRKKPEEEQPARQAGPDWRNVEIAYRRALLEERRATRKAQREEAERERQLRRALAGQQTRAALLMQGMKRTADAEADRAVLGRRRRSGSRSSGPGRRGHHAA